VLSAKRGYISSWHRIGTCLQIEPVKERGRKKGEKSGGGGGGGEGVGGFLSVGEAWGKKVWCTGGGGSMSRCKSDPCPEGRTSVEKKVWGKNSRGLRERGRRESLSLDVLGGVGGGGGGRGVGVATVSSEKKTVGLCWKTSCCSRVAIDCHKRSENEGGP